MKWEENITYRCFIMFRDGPSLVTKRRSEAWAPYYGCYCWSINMADLPSSYIIICTVNDTINHRLLLLSLLFMLFLKQKLKFRREMMAKSWSSERQAMSSVKWSLPCFYHSYVTLLLLLKEIMDYLPRRNKIYISKSNLESRGTYKVWGTINELELLFTV